MIRGASILLSLLLASGLLHAQEVGVPAGTSIQTGQCIKVQNGIMLGEECGTTASDVNHLISGGGVSWAGNLDFIVSAATYEIGGVQYTSAETPVTLAAADPTNPRIDLFVLTDSGTVTVITGTPSTPPVAPVADSITQLALTTITVEAAAVEPANTVEENIYLEDAGPPAEWTCAVSDASFNCASTTNPRTGTTDVEATTATKGDFVSFTDTSTHLLPNFNSLIFYLRSKAAWPSNRNLTIQWYLGSAAQGTGLVLQSGTFNFDSSITASYQQIVIPVGAFGNVGSVDGLRMTVSGGGGAQSIGFFLDDVILQGGFAIIQNVTNIFQGEWNATTSYTTNQIVTYNDITYIATAPSTGETPLTNFDVWLAMGGSQKASTLGGFIGGYRGTVTTLPPFSRGASGIELPWPTLPAYVTSPSFCTSDAADPNEVLGIHWQKASTGASVAFFKDLFQFINTPGSAADCFGADSNDPFPVRPHEFLEAAQVSTGGTPPAMRSWIALTTGVIAQPQAVVLQANVAAGASEFTAAGQHTSFAGAATEQLYAMPVPYAGTVQRMCIWTTTAQPGTGALTVTFRDSGVNTALAITVAASGGSGLYCNLTDTAALVENDWYTIEAANAAGTASATIETISWEFVPTTAGRAMVIFPKHNLALVASASRYSPPWVALATIETTEPPARGPMPLAGTLQEIKCFVETAPANNLVVTVQREGLDGGSTLTITNAGGTGVKSGTGTQAYTELDSFDIEFAAGAGGQATISGCAAEYVY